MTSFRVEHRTTYRYSRPMADGYTIAMLVPRATPNQEVVSSEVASEPASDERIDGADVFGNHVTFLGVHRPHSTLTVTGTSVVTIAARDDPADGQPWERVAAAAAHLHGDDALAVGPFVGSSRFVPLPALGARLHALAARSFKPERPIVDALGALCADLYERFEFDPSFSEVSTPLNDVLEGRRGVCQDFAHLSVGCLRSLGLAARYVSGYIETDPPPGGERLVGADASHAWASAWVPDVGWVDFDPTNGVLPVRRHVTVAWGRDYGDVTPVRGVVVGPSASQELTVSVDVLQV